MIKPEALPKKSGAISFRLAGGAQPLILLPVKVNEQGPFEFILDTGAGTSLLSSETATQLNVKVLGSKEGHSAGGKVSVSLAKVDSLGIGGACLSDVDVGIVDLKHIGAAVGARIDGDLGYNFLRHFRVLIDYGKCQIRFDDAKQVDSFTRRAQVAVTAGVVDLFMVGGARIDSMAVVIADFFAALSEAVGAKLDGIVGYNFLRNYKVVLDYPNERVTLL
jgi:hypothetical protein